MPIRRLVVILVLVSITLLFQPVGVRAQCMVSTTMKFPTTPTVVVYKILSAAYTCSLTMMNAVFCTPTTVAQVTSFLGATANSTVTASPSCVWNCACGTVTIDGGDGLPVELMEFEIEGPVGEYESQEPRQRGGPMSWPALPDPPGTMPKLKAE